MGYAGNIMIDHRSVMVENHEDNGSTQTRCRESIRLRIGFTKQRICVYWGKNNVKFIFTIVLPKYLYFILIRFGQIL